MDNFDGIVKNHPEQHTPNLAYDEQKKQLFEQELSASIKAGRYTLELASVYIERNSRTKANIILEELMESVRAGELNVYAPGSDGPYRSNVVRWFYEEVFWDDLNEWLKNNWPRLGCSFPNPHKSAPQAHTSANGQPDWSDWLSRNHLTLDELLLLSLEESPDDKDLSFFDSIGLNDDETYNKRRDEAISWIKAGLLQGRRANNIGSIEYEQISPVTFFTLAKSKEWDMAQEISDFLVNHKNQKAEAVGDADRMEQGIIARADWQNIPKEASRTEAEAARNHVGNQTDTKESQLHALFWRVYQSLSSYGGKVSAQKVWKEIQHRHDRYDTEEIIQEVNADKISWVSAYGNEQDFKRTSLDSVLSRLKKKPPF